MLETDLQRIRAAYGRLRSEQQKRFFPGEESEAERVISSFVYLLGPDTDYDRCLELFITISSRITLLNAGNERIAMTVASRFADMVPPEKMSALIDCSRRIQDNHSFYTQICTEQYIKLFEAFFRQHAKEVAWNAQNKDDYLNYADFGTDPDNPIYTVFLDGSFVYLNLLYTDELVPLSWVRDGTVHSDYSAGVIDRYALLLPSGELYKTVYVNMYASEEFMSGLTPEGIRMRLEIFEEAE